MLLRACALALLAVAQKQKSEPPKEQGFGSVGQLALLGVLREWFVIEVRHIRLVLSSVWHRGGSGTFRMADLGTHLQHDGSSHQQPGHCLGQSSVARVQKHCGQEAVLPSGFRTGLLYWQCPRRWSCCL